MATATAILVGMAEIHVSPKPALYSCLGLGSCIGFLAYDPASKVSGMIHIMLPEAFRDRPIDRVGKFADVGLPEMIRMMEAQGANTGRLVAAYCGGAQVFQYGNSNGKLDVGARNSAAVAQWLKTQPNIRVLASDVGGSSGRTMTVDIATGTVKVRTIHNGERLLCQLKV